MAHPTAKEKTPASVESSEDDIALMARIASGDEAAFRQLLERHIKRALAFMQRMIGIRQDAEDEVQKAFLKVWQEAPAWRPEAKFSTWFYRVLMNQALDALRRRRPVSDMALEQLADRAPLAEEMLIHNERARLVQKALDALPPRQRQALVLCYYEELSQKEAAAVMGVHEGALESLLTRGRAALKQSITREWYH